MSSREVKLGLGIVFTVFGLVVTLFNLVFFLRFFIHDMSKSPIVMGFGLFFLLIGPLIIALGAFILLSVRKSQSIENELQEIGIEIQGTVVEHVTSLRLKNTKLMAFVAHAENGQQYRSIGMYQKTLEKNFPIGSKITVLVHPKNPHQYWINIKGQASARPN